MDHFNIDNVISAIKGKGSNFSRPLYSLWKHFPGRDIKTSDLIQAHIEFQDQVRSDLIKISPHSKYALVDFGVGFDEKEFNRDTGSYITKTYPIKTVNDWEKIDQFDPQTGELGKQLDLVKQVANRYQNIPTMMTIFLPTMIARKLVFQDKFIEHISEDKHLVKDRLQVITDVMVEFSKICVELGSNGLFLATQETDLADGWDQKLWTNNAYPYDKQILEKLRTKSEFQVLHLHGEKILFKEVLNKFNIDAINFHAFSDFPNFFSENSMKKIYTGGLLGGLKEKYFESSPVELFEAIEPIKDRIILAPNCVLSQSLTMNQFQTIITKIRA